MKRFFFWLLTLLSVCSLLLVVTNIALFNENRTLQQDVRERQKYVSDSMRLNQLNSQLIQLAAQTAASTGDTELRSLLSDNGITYEVQQQPAPAAAPSAAQPLSEGTGDE